MPFKTKTHVPYVSLSQEFDPEQPMGRAILHSIREEMKYGRYTLGPAVEKLEGKWAAICGTKYAIGVNSGTDALILIMKALGIGSRDIIVVTTPISFVATVGAIIAAGATVKFVDIDNSHNLDVKQLDIAGSFPICFVHWAGNPANIDQVPERSLLIEDACQAIGANINGKPAGSFGIAAAFSLHPLKNVNIMGDGGMVTTNDESIAERIRLLRNHGLIDRDTCVRPGVNSRLDTIQALVGLEVLKTLEQTTVKRRHNALLYDNGLCDLPQVLIPPRNDTIRHVYHLYQIEVDRRDELLAWLLSHDIEAKVHYPIPLHLQPGFSFLGYRLGQFPRAEAFAYNHVSLPIHQFLEDRQIEYVIDCIREFYKR